MTKSIFLGCCLVLSGCVAPDAQLRVTEFSGDTGMLSGLVSGLPFDVQANGCIISSVGALPPGLTVVFSGDRCSMDYSTPSGETTIME